ncbi:AAA family ATPase [Asanoa siamensis]|uniref:Adenylyl-sulfate kinase n=1 Tax=Asanoa siamensis TaxID=926357 RepID=A0ABQ4CLB9_9ACTN|nr:ATP-binding protein [Asanoa siamensis]GIF71783.1 adenylyl-sulfate kinase [Asanoa siamensis]
MTPRLVVFAGLPGVGKSTLAARVGAALPAPVLAVDTVDRVLRAHELTEPRPGVAAYGVVGALAEAQLAMGLHAVVDAVNPVAAARAAWPELSDRTGAALRVVEVWCADMAEHRRRVESRHAAAPVNPDWEQVVLRMAEYEPYVGRRLVVDTSVGGDPLPGILSWIQD